MTSSSPPTFPPPPPSLLPLYSTLLNTFSISPPHLILTNYDSNSTCGMKLRIMVCSSLFDGKKLLDRHRLVQKVVEDMGMMKDGTIHAMELKTLTKSELDTKSKDEEEKSKESATWPFSWGIDLREWEKSNPFVKEIEKGKSGISDQDNNEKKDGDKE